MSASITDKFKKVGVAGTLTTMASPGKALAASSVNGNSLTNWPTDTGIIFAIRQVDSDGAEVANTYTEWYGTVSGNTISNLSLAYGTDQVYSAGSTTQMFIPVSAKAENDRMDGILEEHSQLGYHSKALKDSNGNEWLTPSAVASAVNNFQISNAAANGKPVLEVIGSDTNPGGTIKGKGTGRIDVDGLPPQTHAQETQFNHVASGCVWSGDSYGSTRAASMTSGVVYIGGKRLTVAAVSARTFTASKDTYVDAQDNGDGTASLTYTEVTNNAASPALPNSGTNDNTIRLGIIVTGASSIADAGSVNQGQEDKILPIVSSVPYAVTDSLGYLICPRDPNRKLLGYRQIVTTFNTTSTSAVQVTGLSVPFLPVPNRKHKLRFHIGASLSSSGSSQSQADLWEGTVGSGTLLDRSIATSAGTGYPHHIQAEKLKTYTSASLVTINGGFSVNTGGQTIQGSATTPVYVSVELE